MSTATVTDYHIGDPLDERHQRRREAQKGPALLHREALPGDGQERGPANTIIA